MMYTDLYSFEGPAATDAVSVPGAARKESMKAESERDPARWKTMFAGAVGTVIVNLGVKPQHNRK